MFDALIFLVLCLSDYAVSFCWLSKIPISLSGFRVIIFKSLLLLASCSTLMSAGLWLSLSLLQYFRQLENFTHETVEILLVRLLILPSCNDV